MVPPGALGPPPTHLKTQHKILSMWIVTRSKDFVTWKRLRQCHIFPTFLFLQKFFEDDPAMSHIFLSFSINCPQFYASFDTVLSFMLNTLRSFHGLDYVQQVIDRQRAKCNTLLACTKT